MKYLAMWSLCLGLVACESTGSSNKGDATPSTTPQDSGSSDTGSSTPMPTKVSPSPGSATTSSYSVPDGTSGKAADFCTSSGNDPRKGLEVGNDCIDNLILRAFVPSGASAGRLLLNSNFSDLKVTAGGSSADSNAAPLDAPLQMTLRTIPNLLPGGERVELSFEATVSSSKLTVGEVTITPL